MAERFQVVPAAYVILRRGNEILLQLRSGTGYMDGYWACAAAGRVEAGESVVDAALREAREELGVEIVVKQLRPLCAMQRSQAPHGPIDERVDFFFECDEWLGEPAIGEPEKAADLGWFDLQRLPANVVPHEARVLVDLANQSLMPIMTFGFDSR